MEGTEIARLHEAARRNLETGAVSEAMSQLQQAFHLDPRRTETLDLLARAYRQAGFHEKARFVDEELARLRNDLSGASGS